MPAGSVPNVAGFQGVHRPVVPGCWFEMPDHFRIGFGLRTSDFEEGLSRLGSALDDLG